jgi:hypothetical protein
MFDVVGRIADVGVDLATPCDADTHRLQIAVVYIGRDHHSSAGDFFTNHFGLQSFPLRNIVHRR